MVFLPILCAIFIVIPMLATRSRHWEISRCFRAVNIPAWPCHQSLKPSSTDIDWRLSCFSTGVVSGTPLQAKDYVVIHNRGDEMAFVKEFISEADREKYRLDDYKKNVNSRSWVIDRARDCFFSILRGWFKQTGYGNRKTLWSLAFLLSRNVCNIWYVYQRF